MTKITTHTLECGAVLIAEVLPAARSAAVAWHVPCGITAEPADRLGLTGVVCEMLMRGAGDRDARAQADAFDAVGATRDIAAGLRGTQIASITTGDRLPDLLPLLAETVRRPRLNNETFVPSRELSLQALESLGDDPRERASIAARAAFFPEPYNRSSYGTREGLTAATADDAAALWAGRALPGSSIIAVAGAVDADAIRDRLDGLLEGWAGSAERIEPAGGVRAAAGHIEDDSSQVQIIALRDAPTELDQQAAVREKIAASVLSGGMSGRLFTEVREKRGLCYAVAAAYRGDDLFGRLSAYVGTTPERAQESLDVLLAELDRIRTPAGAVTADEIDRAIIGLKSSVVFHGESTQARAASLVSDVIKLGRARTLDEISAAYDAVSLDDLNSYLVGSAAGAQTIQTLGPTALATP
ncbi:MAG: insulinase family protein [Planctomycetota bacterium]